MAAWYFSRANTSSCFWPRMCSSSSSRSRRRSIAPSMSSVIAAPTSVSATPGTPGPEGLESIGRGSLHLSFLLRDTKPRNRRIGDALTPNNHRQRPAEVNAVSVCLQEFVLSVLLCEYVDLYGLTVAHLHTSGFAAQFGF